MLLWALLLGAASAFAFAPFGLWPLMPLSFALLAELVSRQTRLRGALGIGWAYGVGQFCVGLNWIATAFTYQAAMPAWLGWIAVVLLSLYLAVYPAMSTGLAWRFGRENRLALVLALGGSWALTEWLRATMFTGFAWNPVGVTLVDTWWRQTSGFIGTYGLSTLVALAGGFAWMAARRAWKAPLAFAAIALLLLALPTPEPQANDLKTFDIAGKASPLPTPPALPQPDRAPPPAPVTAHSAFSTGRVRVVQPNIGQADKWREGFDDVAAARLAGLSRAPDAKARDLGPPETLYWPEAAVTEPLLDERRAAAPFVTFERMRAARSIAPGQLLATGGIALTSSDGATVDGATNSVFVLDSGGRIVGRYDKAHLVPYGEYLPMRTVLGAIGLSRLAPGDLDFIPGPGPRTLRLPNGRKMGVQICYEIIFSGEVVDASGRPDHLFNPSNDAWFGAWGPPQHLAQARLRAAEEAVPIIRATPTGISAVIDASGATIGAVGAGEANVIDSPLPPAGPPTLFSRAGNLVPLLLGAILLAAAIALGRRRR